MQYLMGINSARGLYVDHDGVFQNMCNVNSTSDSSPYCISPLVPSSTTQVLVNTEAIKKTIFGHEALFRNQVIDLHRLYDKQRELMNELKNDFSRENTQVRLGSSQYGMAEEKQSNVSWLSPCYVPQSVSWLSPCYDLHRLYDKQRELMNELKNDFSRENTQVRLGSSQYGMAEEKQSNVSWLSPCYVPQSVAHKNHFELEVGENVHTDRAVSQAECTSRQCELVDASRCKKYNNKVLDLQLLATEYMDDEDTTSSVVPEATYPVRFTSPFSPTNDKPVDQQPLELGIHEKGTYAESASAHGILFDLNEPFNYEEATPTRSHEEILCKDISRNATQLFGCSSAVDTDKSIHESVAVYNDFDNHDNIVQISCDHEPGQKTSDSNFLNQDYSNPSSSVVSAVSPNLKPKPCNEHLGDDDKLKRPSKKRTLKLRKAQGCLAFSENKAVDTLIRFPKSFKLIPVCDKTKTHSMLILPPIQSVLDFRRNPIAVQALPCINAPVTIQKKKSKSFSAAAGTDRNNSLLSKVQHYNPHAKNSVLSPSTHPVKPSRKVKRRRTNLRASNVNWDSYQMEPPSPENEESAPPRGESDENFSEKRRQFYTVGDWDTETDVTTNAAHAIVFLSAADVCIDRHSVFEPSLLSPANPLLWFAEVVSNVEFANEGLPPLAGRPKESIFNLDDFESMNLKLEDTNKEENYCRSIITCQNEKLTLVTTVSGRATRARGKRSKKLKHFQGVILPGISSLSKHEVTEDLHLIEGLMEATGTPNIIGSKKRNTFSGDRRQSSNTASIIAENSPCLLLDLQNDTSIKSQTNERKRTMIDWGKITRRRRGQRYPARKLTFVQVAHTLKAH